MVVGDIGRKIGRLTVFSNNHTVFFISKIGAAKPGCPVFLIEIIISAQDIDGFLYLVCFGQAFFRKPVIENYAEFSEIIFNIIANSIQTFFKQE